jgi:hypothetical protein
MQIRNCSFVQCVETAERIRDGRWARQITGLALAARAQRIIVGRMNKIWKIISSTERMGGGGPPLKEYFLVAIGDQANALSSLKHKRPDIELSKLSVVGEANADYVEWLNVRDGDIVCLQAL